MCIRDRSGCVGVNLMPRFSIPITFLAFRSISLAVCSLVSIKGFPAIVYARSMYFSLLETYPVSKMRFPGCHPAWQYGECRKIFLLFPFSPLSAYIYQYGGTTVSSNISPGSYPQSSNSAVSYTHLEGHERKAHGQGHFVLVYKKRIWFAHIISLNSL